MKKSTNNRYFLVVGNLTYCTPDTIKSEVVQLGEKDKYKKVLQRRGEVLKETVRNHPDDEIIGVIYPEKLMGKDGRIHTCTEDAAVEEFTAFRDYLVLKDKLYD